MPTRPAPKNWRSRGIEQLDVRHRYTTEVLAAICATCPTTDEAVRQSLEVKILNIAGALNADLYFEGRPSDGEKRAALETIERHARALRDALGALDDDTARLLVEVADEDKRDPHVEGPFDGGPTRFRKAAESVDKLLGWSAHAKKRLPGAKKGRRTKEAVARAVFCLADAWYRASGKAPGRLNTNGLSSSPEHGAFREFANTALRPLDIKVSDETAKLAIARWKKRVTRPD